MAPRRPRPTHAHIYHAGPYQVRLTVSDGVNSTISAPLSISAGNRPTVTILAPTDGATFRAGDVINFSGTATDVEDGDAARECLHLEHRLPARHPCTSRHSDHRRDEWHVHDPDQRARFQRLHPISRQSHRHRFERAAVDQLGHHLPAEGQSHLQCSPGGGDHLPGRHRPHGAVRLRRPDRFQPHHLCAQPDDRRQRIQLRLMVGRWRSDITPSSCPQRTKPIPPTSMPLHAGPAGFCAGECGDAANQSVVGVR